MEPNTRKKKKNNTRVVSHYLGGNVNGDTFSQLSIYCIATKAIENRIYRYLEYIVLIYNRYMYRVSQYHTTNKLP